MTSWVKTKTKHGDTLTSLQARYGVSRRELLSMNGVTPREEHTEKYRAVRGKELGLPAATPPATASKVIEEDDISIWVSDAGGRAVELQPGAWKDIQRFATCPSGDFAVFEAGNVIYLPEWTVRDAQLPAENIKAAQVKPTPQLGGPMTGIAQALARIPHAQQKYLGNYSIGSVPADAVVYDTTKMADVFQIQGALNRVWGANTVSFYDVPPKGGPAKGLAEDGVYGPKTTEAVRRFQLANGLAVTGVVDRATSLKLQDDDAHEITSPPPAKTPAAHVSSSAGMWGLLGLLGLAGAGVAVWQARRKKNPSRRRLNPRRRARTRQRLRVRV